MRNYFLLFLSLLIISCGKTTNEPSTNNTNPLHAIVSDISMLEDGELSGKMPIKTFTDYAKTKASKAIEIDKSNMEFSLNTAKKYGHAFIIVGNHTIIKIIDLNDCKPSASWGTCMPMAEGYVKKGKLQHEKDYCNNIIGLPDNQERTLYLFD